MKFPYLLLTVGHDMFERYYTNRVQIYIIRDQQNEIQQYPGWKVRPLLKVNGLDYTNVLYSTEDGFENLGYINMWQTDYSIKVTFLPRYPNFNPGKSLVAVYLIRFLDFLRKYFPFSVETAEIQEL